MVLWGATPPARPTRRINAFLLPTGGHGPPLRLLLLVRSLPGNDLLHHAPRAVVQHGAPDPADGGAGGPRLFQNIQIDQPLLQIHRHVKPLLQAAQLGGGAQVIEEPAALLQVLQLQDRLLQGHAPLSLFRFRHK